MVLGKTMKEQLRFAVSATGTTSAGSGFDPFSYSGTLSAPWFTIADPMEAAKAKADEAFAFISKLGVPYYAFTTVTSPPKARPRRNPSRT